MKSFLSLKKSVFSGMYRKNWSEGLEKEVIYTCFEA